MSGRWAALAALVPAPSGGGGLDAALDSPLGVLLRPLGDTPQEPRWHGEGDVLTHTRLVLEALAEADARGRLAADRAEVLLLCGLPGTGKDTWLRANAPGLAVVSPDEVRAEYGLPPTGPQEEVMRLAAERAKALLRQRIPFAWNATSVSQSLRARQLELFSRYGARVRIVCLETGWETGLARNAARALGGCACGLAVYLSRKTACAPSAGAGFQRRPGVGFGWAELAVLSCWTLGWCCLSTPFLWCLPKETGWSPKERRLGWWRPREVSGPTRLSHSRGRCHSAAKVSASRTD